MTRPPRFCSKIRFGPFEFDPAVEELRKRGIRIKLQKQPFRVLAALLARPNEVVSREELHQTLWASDTFVDFEHGLHAAVNKLRQALSDSADNPQYIETVQGAGYKWLGAVETDDPVVSAERPAAVEKPPQSLAPRRPFAGWVHWVLPLITLLGGIVCGYRFRAASDPKPPAQRLEFTVPPPEGFVFEPAITRQDFAISPDGTRLAFIASDANTSRLWVRELASLGDRPLAPERSVRGVAWSPDSKFLYFDERTTIRRVSADSGSVQTICQLPMGPPWMGLLRLGDDLILYTRAGTYKLPSPGGTPHKLDESPYTWTQALPANRVLHVEYNAKIHRYDVVASSLTNKNDQRVMTEADSRAMYSPPQWGERVGNLLYVRAGSLIAHPFDANSLRLAGDPWVIAERVFSMAPSAAAAFSVSENGVLVYREAPPVMQLKWFDRVGRELGAVGAPAAYLGLFRLSPDGRKLAAPIYDVEKGGMDIWIQDLAGHGSKRKLTNAPGARSSPVWSPHGDRVAFLRAEGGLPQLYWCRTDSPREEEALPAGFFQVPTDWSRDGRFLAYQTGGGVGEPDSDISVVDLLNGRRILPLIHSPARELGAVLCPDSTCLAFLSDETGRTEAYLQDLESETVPRVAGKRRQISTDGALAVRWRSDGRELYYLNSENWIVAVPVDRRQHSFGPPQRLFRSVTPLRNLNVAGPDWGFDVSADGQRFLMVDGRGSRPSPLVVIENWHLTRR